MNCNNHFCLKKVGDTIFLQGSDSATHKMIFLNETGAFLWKKINECVTKESLVKELIAAYDVQKNTAEKDIAEFLAFLEENGCLMRED